MPCLQLIEFLLVWVFSFIETKFDLSQKPVIFGSSGNRLHPSGYSVVFFSPNVLALSQFQIWPMKNWSGLVQILHTKQPYFGSLKIKKYRKSILHFWGGGVGRRCAIGSWEHLKWEGTQFSVMTMMCFVSRHNHTHGDVCHVALVCRRHSLLFRVKMRSSAMILIIIIALVKRKRSLLVLVSSIFKDVPHLIYNGGGAPLK